MEVRLLIDILKSDKIYTQKDHLQKQVSPITSATTANIACTSPSRVTLPCATRLHPSAIILMAPRLHSSACQVAFLTVGLHPQPPGLHSQPNMGCVPIIFAVHVAKTEVYQNWLKNVIKCRPRLWTLSSSSLQEHHKLTTLLISISHLNHFIMTFCHYH